MLSSKIRKGKAQVQVISNNAGIKLNCNSTSPINVFEELYNNDFLVITLQTTHVNKRQEQYNFNFAQTVTC